MMNVSQLRRLYGLQRRDSAKTWEIIDKKRHFDNDCFENHLCNLVFGETIVDRNSKVLKVCFCQIFWQMYVLIFFVCTEAEAITQKGKICNWLTMCNPQIFKQRSLTIGERSHCTAGQQFSKIGFNCLNTFQKQLIFFFGQIHCC